MGDLLFRHSLPRILDADLHIISAFLGTDKDLPTRIREFPGIISQRVDHEQGQGLVSLDHGLGRLNDQIHSLQGKS